MLTILLTAAIVVSVEEVVAQQLTPPETSSGLPAWISAHGKIRVRPEVRRSRRFVDDSDESYSLTQFRFGLGIRAGSATRVYFEGQDARAPGLPRAGTALRDPLDIYQGYAELGQPDGRFRIRVGRQEMAYGQERLISANPWRNTGRSFDAARVMIGTPSLGVDIFASAIVRKDPDGFDTWQDGESLYGGYGRLGDAETGLRVEPYLLVRTRSLTDHSNLDERRFSLGARITHRSVGPVDLAGEVVRQFGDSGHASIAAWMTYGIVGYNVPHVGWRPRLEWEYSHASGDADPEDERLQGFDTLYSTPHRFYGYADLIGGRNLRDARFSISVRPVATLSVAVDIHRFWLATRHDALYDTALTPLFVVPPDGAVTSAIGSEVDATVTYRVTEWLTIGGGWSRFFLGRLLEPVLSGRASTFAYGLIEARYSID